MTNTIEQSQSGQVHSGHTTSGQSRSPHTRSKLSQEFSWSTFVLLYRIIGKGETSELSAGAASTKSKKGLFAKIGGLFSPKKKTGNAADDATSAGASAAGSSASSDTETRSISSKLKGRGIGRVLGAMLAIAYLSAFMGYWGYSTGDYSILSLTFYSTSMMSLVVTLFMGLYAAINSLYFAKDITYYLTLPISGSVIMWAKFARHLVSMVGGTLFIAAYPIGVAIRQEVPFMTYVIIILGFIINLAIVNILLMYLVLLLMRFNKFMYNKDRFARIAGAVIIIFVCVIGVSFQLLSLIAESDFVAVLFDPTKASLVVKIFFGIFSPMMLFSTNLFSNNLLEAFGSLAAGLGLAVLYLVILGIIGKFLYFTTIRAMQGGGATKQTRVLTKDQMSKATASRSTRRSLMSQYWKLQVRTPVFFNNNILSVLLSPLYIFLIMVVSIYMMVKNSRITFEQFLSSRASTFEWLTFDSEFVYYGLYGALALTLFATMNSYIALVSVSSDGEDFFWFKSLPIRWRTYLLARFIPIFLLMCVPTFILEVVSLLFFYMPVWQVVYFLVVQIALSLGILGIGMLGGTIKPNLHWTSERELIKGIGNLARVYGGMLLALVLLTPSILLTIMCQKAWITPEATVISVLIVSLIEGVFGVSLMLIYGPKNLQCVEG